MIVVGFDGSPHGMAALHWAGAEARLRSCELRVLHGWHIPQVMELVGADRHGSGVVPAIDELQQVAQHQLEQQVAEALPEGAGLVRCEAAHGDAVDLLLAASADAELLVVGTRGHGRAASMLLGSVSLACVHEASCPVVVVRPRKR